MPLLQHKDFILDTLEIQSVGGSSPIDIRGIFKEFIIYEDMFSPTLSGSVMIITSLPIDEILPLTGQDTIHISFKSVVGGLSTSGKITKGGKNSNISISAILYKVSDISRNTDRSYVMILHFASAEALANQKIKICRQFDGEFSENVSACWAAIGSKKKMRIAGGVTKQKHKMLIPNWNPFTAINWFATRSTPIRSEGTAANYVFYEKLLTQGGSEFVYNSLDSLVGGNVKKTFVHMESNVAGDQENLNKNNVEAYKIMASYDHLKELITGSLGGSNIIYDLTRKRWDRHEYSYFDDFGQQSNLESNPNTPELSGSDKIGKNANISLHCKAEGLFAGNIDEITNVSSKVEETAWRRRSFIARHNLTKCIIRVAGDSNLRLGDVVEWKLPSNRPQTKGAKIYNEYLNNRWYVSSIKHVVENEEGYVQSIELLKDSLPKKLPKGGISGLISGALSRVGVVLNQK